MLSLVAVVVAFLVVAGAATTRTATGPRCGTPRWSRGPAAVETMTTMDCRDVEMGIKAWQGVSTGVLHDQLLAVGGDQQMLADQGKIASGRVVQAALTELTDRSATLLAAVEVTVEPVDGREAGGQERNRFSADLGW